MEYPGGKYELIVRNMSNSEVVVVKCRDCGGSGKGQVKGSRCGTCNGSGQSVSVVKRK